MDPLKDFERSLSRKERAVFTGLRTPAQIQGFLDTIAYCGNDPYYSPRTVLKVRKACCLDGALFAATALRRLGYPPLIVCLMAENDDDHIVALYKKDGCVGAIAKSNFAGLRFREPVYRSVRELMMSYFEFYFNLHGEKTLRGYTVPLDLRKFDHLHWMMHDDTLEVIADRLDEIRQFSLLTPGMVRSLCRLDTRSYEAGMYKVDTAAIYTPRKKRP